MEIHETILQSYNKKVRYGWEVTTTTLSIVINIKPQHGMRGHTYIIYKRPTVIDEAAAHFLYVLWEIVTDYHIIIWYHTQCPT